MVITSDHLKSSLGDFWSLQIVKNVKIENRQFFLKYFAKLSRDLLNLEKNVAFSIAKNTANSNIKKQYFKFQVLVGSAALMYFEETAHLPQAAQQFFYKNDSAADILNFFIISPLSYKIISDIKYAVIFLFFCFKAFEKNCDFYF